MKHPTALVADDEPLLRAQLRETLAEVWPELTIVAEASDGAEAIRLVRSHAPGFAFLDIEMPVMNGLDAARAVRELTQVVFVTAYDRHAVAAFERGAVDYVLKPATSARLADTVMRLKARTTPPAMDALLAELAQRLPAGNSTRLEWLQASVGGTIRLINVDDVLYFQSDSKYTRVVTEDGEALIGKTLKEMLADLDPRHFWQVHRATIVHVRAIAGVATDGFGHKEIQLKTRPERLEVSRSFSHLFKQM